MVARREFPKPCWMLPSDLGSSGTVALDPGGVGLIEPIETPCPATWTAHLWSSIRARRLLN